MWGVGLLADPHAGWERRSGGARRGGTLPAAGSRFRRGGGRVRAGTPRRTCIRGPVGCGALRSLHSLLRPAHRPPAGDERGADLPPPGDLRRVRGAVVTDAFDLAILGSGFAGSLLAMVARRLGRSVI